MAVSVLGLVRFAGVVPLLLGTLMAIYWQTRKVYRGFGFWLLADFSLGLALILLSLRGQISDGLSVVGANALIVYTGVLIYEGIERFFGRSGPNAFNHILLVLYIALQMWLTYVHPDTNLRLILQSVVIGIQQSRIVYSLFVHAPARLRLPSRTTGIIFALSAVLLLVRGAYVFLRGTQINIATDPSLVVVVFVWVCAAIIWTFYFIFLNGARVEYDLEDASDKLADSVDTSRREIVQLALLDEVGQLVSDTLDETEILQRAVEAVVDRFGYAEAAISMLASNDQLELRALGGTENIGYELGYRQNMGEGIIGHVAQTQRVYVTSSVEKDPYYFTLGQRTGSAAGVPMLTEGKLQGVLYVESTKHDAFSKTDIQMLRALVSHIVTAVNKARLYGSTQQHLQVMTTLHSISQIITSSLDLDRILQTVLQELKDSFGYRHISIYLLRDGIMHLGAQIGYPEPTTIQEIPITEGIIGRTVQTRTIQFLRDVTQDPAFLRAARDVTSEICVPLFRKGEVLGVINVEGSRRSPLTERDVDVLSALAGSVAIAIDNAHLHAEAKALARIDGLTGVMNRRTFDQTLASELARAIRYDYPLTLIILDIDDFKLCNDQWGHPAGDALLKAAANLIEKTTRISDCVARYGGDEFAVILPNTGLADGLELSERLRVSAGTLGRDVEGGSIPAGDYTFSLGVASFPAHGRTAEELLVAADHAELVAKQGGKNQVCAAQARA